MTITSRHSKVSGKSDGLDTTLVQPSDWNNDHAIKCDQDKLLGRVSAGNGLIEEIACTAYARTLLAAANVAAAWALIKQTVLLTEVDVVGGTGLTAPAVDDSLPVYDLSATANRKIALSDLFKVIDGLTAKTAPAAADEVAIYDVAGTAAKKVLLSELAKSPAFKPMTRQRLTSGTAATYTTPAGCKAIRVIIVPGGGGGGAANSGNGSDGTASTFNSVTANPGRGGPASFTSNAAPGGTGGTGSATFRLPGSAGSPGQNGADNACAGSVGAPGLWGLGAGQGTTGAGGNGAANTGAGGAGGGGNNTGGGGSQGEYVELEISNPSPTYIFTVGPGGNGGSGVGSAGGNGGSGIIIVEEFY